MNFCYIYIKKIMKYYMLEKNPYLSILKISALIMVVLNF